MAMDDALHVIRTALAIRDVRVGIVEEGVGRAIVTAFGAK